MYTEPHQFEPLLPSDARMEPLLGKAHDLSRQATLLTGTRVPPELRRLLRKMNSYYTNRIEGQHTRPHEIEQALQQNFSNDTSLVLGKYLSPRLYVSYGISLAEAINTVKLRYTVGDHWTIKTESGKARSADLVYTIQK